MFEAFNKNKYFASGVIQHMLNNAWPSTIWHLYDYYLNADAGYFGTQRACEPLHIQYSYDDHTIVVVNSSYQPSDGLHATVHVHNEVWKELFSNETTVDASPDSAQSVSLVPADLYKGADKILFVDLTLADAAGRIVSRNVYWVPAKTTEFDWPKSNAHGTMAIHYEDLSELANLPQAKILSRAELEKTLAGRQLKIQLDNPSANLAFQIRVSLHTSAGDLIAPVLWSDNWIELVPGESRTLTAQLPKDSAGSPVVQVDGWNIPSETITSH